LKFHDIAMDKAEASMRLFTEKVLWKFGVMMAVV
jgi:hypothetical protein